MREGQDLDHKKSIGSQGAPPTPLQLSSLPPSLPPKAARVACLNLTNEDVWRSRRRRKEGRRRRRGRATWKRRNKLSNKKFKNYKYG